MTEVRRRLVLNPYLRGAPRPARPVIVGHRGACGLAPENTLDSFELAFELGADMVECDVHLTRDRRVVVIHDDTLLRTTDARARFPGRASFQVSDAGLEEVTALDAGGWFLERLERRPLPPPFGPTDEERRSHLGAAPLARYGGGRVHPPTLAATLELVKRRRGALMIELKMIPRFYPGLVEAALEEVRALGMEEQVVFSSFDHRSVAEVKRLFPGVAAGVLTVERLHDPGRYVAEVVGGDSWNPGCLGEIDTLGFGSVGFEARGAEALDAAGVAGARARGVGVFVWTENDPARQRALLGLGVTGVITDFPGRLASLVRGEGGS